MARGGTLVPVELVNVDRIDSTTTNVPDCRRFLITGTTVAFPSQTVQYLTVNPFRASLCERAKAKGQTVQVTWNDSRWGRELVNVEPAQ